MFKPIHKDEKGTLSVFCWFGTELFAKLTFPLSLLCCSMASVAL